MLSKLIFKEFFLVLLCLKHCICGFSYATKSSFIVVVWCVFFLLMTGKIKMKILLQMDSNYIIWWRTSFTPIYVICIILDISITLHLCIPNSECETIPVCSDIFTYKKCTHYILVISFFSRLKTNQKSQNIEVKLE